MTRWVVHPAGRGSLRCGLLAAMAIVIAACGEADRDPSGEQASPDQAEERSLTAGAEPDAPRIEPAAARPTEPMAADATCVTAACHVDFREARFVHGPADAGGCAACHRDDAGGHTFPLKREGAELCTHCHGTVVGEAKHVHAAVTDSGCRSCHDPHMSSVKYLMAGISVQAVCLRCHTIEGEAHMHEPVAEGRCSTCHEPHASETAGLLRGGGEKEHCLLCHQPVRDTLAKAEHAHEAVEQGCTTCHAAHGAPTEHLLSESLVSQCLSCHTEMRQHIAEAKFSHSAGTEGEGCVRCHASHVSDRRKLLRGPVVDLCMQCHDQPVTTAKGREVKEMTSVLARQFLHGPVRQGECAACHNGHGAEHAGLLRSALPDSFYAPFDLDNYALCFECHNEQIVQDAETDELTGFRDSERNLHYVHVHREQRGRTCRTCHATHASDQPKHMADSVPFEGSSWSMPINFTKSQTGGRCAPACHEPMTYERGSGGEPDAAPGD